MPCFFPTGGSYGMHMQQRHRMWLVGKSVGMTRAARKSKKMLATI